jgi:hypothetical protein
VPWVCAVPCERGAACAAATHGDTAADRVSDASAAGQANPANRLGVVTPVMACSQLAALDLTAMTGTGARGSARPLGLQVGLDLAHRL